MSFYTHGSKWLFVLKKKNEEEDEKTDDESVAADDDRDESKATDDDEDESVAADDDRDESKATDDDEDESIATDNDEEMIHDEDSSDKETNRSEEIKINDEEMIHDEDSSDKETNRSEEIKINEEEMIHDEDTSDNETNRTEETDDEDGDDEDEESLSTDDEGGIDEEKSNNETESSEETSDNEIVPIESFDKENLMIVEDDLFDKELDECILELLDEVILEICFESHRAAKLGFIEGKLSLLYWRNYRPRNEKESVVIENTGKGKKKVTTIIMCPNVFCNYGRKKESTIFAKHFNKCIYRCGRSTKKTNFYEDTSSITQKKQRRKPSNTQAKQRKKPSNTQAKQRKKPSTTQTKQRRKGSTTAFTVESLSEMSLDEKRKFFDEHCGVKLTYSKKDALCVKKPSDCTLHKDEQRKTWSGKHLGVPGTYQYCY